MLTLFSAIFDNPLGKLAAVAASVAALFVWFVVDQRQVGAERALIQIERQEEKSHAKAINARKPAERDGAAERLRHQSCRDC